MPTAPILLCAQRRPHCSEQKAPIYAWYRIRTVSVLGQISPHLRLLVSVLVDILGWSHLSWGLLVFLISWVFSHRLLEMNTQLSVSSAGRAPKRAAPSLAPRHCLCLPHAVPPSVAATVKSRLSSRSRHLESRLLKWGVVVGWKSSVCFTSSIYGFKRNKTWLLGCGCCSRKPRPFRPAEAAACAPPASEGSLEVSNAQIGTQGCSVCNKNFFRQSSPLALGALFPPQRAQEKWGDGPFSENQEGWTWSFPKRWCFGEGVSSCSMHLLHCQQMWWVDNFLIRYRFLVFNWRFKKKNRKALKVSINLQGYLATL